MKSTTNKEIVLELIKTNKELLEKVKELEERINEISEYLELPTSFDPDDQWRF